MIHAHPLSTEKPRAFALAALMVLAIGLTASSELGAQIQQANYPLTTDLLDTTGTYGPVSLLGTTPPAAPAANGVCHNGVWLRNSGGQGIATANIATLDPTDGQIDVEFNLTSFGTNPFFGTPVIIAGDLQRWIGIEVNPSGMVVLLHNNSVRTTSTMPVTVGTWYSASLRFQNGVAQLFLDGALIAQATTGVLTDNGDRDIRTGNWSTGTGLSGCIRNLVISNSTTLFGGEYQVNSPAASLVFDGLPDPGAFAPIITESPVGFPVPMDLTSTNLGLPWDVALTTVPAVPWTSGGFATAGGQLGNLNLADPSFTTLFGLSFSNAFVDLTGVPLLAAPGVLSAQLVVIDPFSIDGIALSHVNQVEFLVCSNTENFDSATTGTPGNYPDCWTDGGGNQPWRVNSGGTTSGSTGPSGDNTTGSGNYMYCETSAPSATNDTYILNAPPSLPTVGAAQFSYHMYGATVGTLELQELQGAGTWTTVWSLSGDQGNAWNMTPLILLSSSTTTLRFVYTRGSSFTGDVAIDDFEVF